AARSAATIGEGLALAAQYAPARAPQFAATFDTATDPAALTIALRVAVDADVGAAMCEAATLSAVAMIASLADGPLTILAYDWPWGPPAHAEALRQAAPGTHRFNAATCTLHVPHAIADQPSPHRDAGLLAATIANLETAKAQDPSMPVGHRLAALLASPEGPMTSAADAAKHLGLSGRTLARRLTEEGTNFRAKRDEALKAHAEVLLADQRLSRDTIAERLGFDDPTSFSRACRRWFGEGPRAVRQRMDGGLTPRQ
ncbi:MAG: helix-turn-helix domain-containing protein, partial [Pseudomonadota bacterium]